MLYKSELETIPPLEVEHNCQVSADVVTLKKSGRVLVCDFVCNGKRNRFFTDGKSYLTRKADSTTYSQCYPTNAYALEDSKGSREIVEAFLNEKGSVTWAVKSFVGHKKWTAAQRSSDRKWKLEKQHFAMFPEYPANLGEYCENHIFRHSYIFVQKKDGKGHRFGICSHCGKKILLDGKNQPTGAGNCPECGHRILYKQGWRKEPVEDKEKVCIAHKVNSQLLIRWVEVTRHISRPDTKVSFSFDDYGYNLHLNTPKGNVLYCYKYFTSYMGYGPTWHRFKNGDIIYDETYVYTDNLREVFGERHYNVNIQAGLAGKPCKLSFAMLLNNLRDKPVAEYLFKLGLPILAASAGSLVSEPTGNGAFFRATGVSKQYLPMYRDMCVTMIEHRLIKKSKQFVHPEDLQTLRDFGLKSDQLTSAADLMEEMSIPKFVRYMRAQAAIKRSRRFSMNQLITEYRDYISMSKDLGVDLSHKSVRYPADVVEAHKVITDRFNLCRKEIEQRKNAEVDKKFNERVQTLYQQFGITDFASGSYCIVFPQLRSDLIVEGQSLNHCVGQTSYYENHMRGTKMIFFVREQSNPRRPFFTMELDMSTFKILQLYGFGDCTAPKDVRSFAEKFAQRLMRSMYKKTA